MRKVYDPNRSHISAIFSQRFVKTLFNRQRIFNARMYSLTLKNYDNKSVAAVWNAAIKWPIAQHSAPTQRGFVAGRSLLANVVDLDAAARTARSSTPARRVAAARMTRS